MEEENVVYCYRREALVGLECFFGLDILEELRMAADDLYHTIVILEANNSAWHVANTIDNGHPRDRHKDLPGRASAREGGDTVHGERG